MKKILLFLSIALFLSAGVVTATKIQSLNSTSTEMIVSAGDLDSIAPLVDDDEKKDKKKSAKATKCAKEDCKEKDCKESCNKTATKGKEKCAGEAKKCCSKDKGKK